MSFGVAYSIALGALLALMLVTVVRPALRDAEKLPPRRRVTLLFERRDLWVGVYRDTARGTTYICPLPCVVIRFAPRDTEQKPEGDSQ